MRRILAPSVAVIVASALALSACPAVAAAEAEVAISRIAGSPPATPAGVPAIVDKSTWSDFDGNGWADLAIGVPNETVGPDLIRGGAVHVLYGFEDGLHTSGSDFWHQNVDGIANSAEQYDLFGASLATGDFDHDGYGDLAIGVPNEDLIKGGVQITNVGMVHVLLGSPDGLTPTGSSVKRGIDENEGANTQFGYALATGEILDPAATGWHGIDGFVDLVVGAPGANKVHLYSGQYFSAAVDPTVTTQIAEDLLTSQGWGSVIAVGEIHADAGEEVILGLPTADSGAPDGGAIWVESANRGTRYYQGSGAAGVAEDADRFGSALASVDLNGDGWDEVIVGVPREDVSGRIDAGVINVLWGGEVFFSASTWYSQSVAGGAIEAGDRFGWSLARGAFDADTPDKLYLAVSAPGEDRGSPTIYDAGAVAVVRQTSGTSLTGSFRFQGSGQVGETGESGDNFGRTLAANDYGEGPADDLVVGVPYEGMSGLGYVGLVQVIYGTSSGPDGSVEDIWSQASSGIPDSPEAGDRFGEPVH